MQLPYAISLQISRVKLGNQREGEREGERERGREGERERGREGGREGGSEGRRVGWWGEGNRAKPGNQLVSQYYLHFFFF